MSKITPTPGNPTNSKRESGVPTNVSRDRAAYTAKLLSSTLEEQKKIQNRKKYRGIVLYNKTIRTQDFVKRFDEDFATYVLRVKSTDADQISHISHVNETTVYILEVCGALPFPDMTLIEEKIQQLRLEISNEEDADFKKLSEKRKGLEWSDFKKALDRLDRFPRFYSSQQSRNSSSDVPSLSRGDTVFVEFLDEDDWSTSGILLGSGA